MSEYKAHKNAIIDGRTIMSPVIECPTNKVLPVGSNMPCAEAIAAELNGLATARDTLSGQLAEAREAVRVLGGECHELRFWFPNDKRDVKPIDPIILKREATDANPIATKALETKPQ